MGSKGILVFRDNGSVLVGKTLDESENGGSLLLPGSAPLLVGQNVRADYAGFAIPASVDSTLRSVEGMQVALRFADPSTVLRWLP